MRGEYNWLTVYTSRVGHSGSARNELESATFYGRPAGHVVMGKLDALLNYERSRVRRGEPIDGFVADARVWDYDTHLQWYGDLDVSARAHEVQRVADLVGTTVYVTERFGGPLVNGRPPKSFEGREIWAFEPRVACRGSLLAQLSRLDVRDRGRAGGEPARWEPLGRARKPACVMDFSPAAQQHVLSCELPELNGSQGEIQAARLEIRRLIQRQLAEDELAIVGEVSPELVLDRYVHFALAGVLDELQGLRRARLTSRSP